LRELVWRCACGKCRAVDAALELRDRRVIATAKGDGGLGGRGEGRRSAHDHGFGGRRILGGRLGPRVFILILIAIGGRLVGCGERRFLFFGTVTTRRKR